MSANLRSLPTFAGTIRLRVVYDQQLRRPVAASVLMDRQGEGTRVTTVTLREVRVQEAVKVSAGRRLVKVARGPGKLLSLYD